MKKNILLSLALISSLFSFSQIDLETILDGGTADAQKFLKGYLEPAPNGFGYGINGGWYSTAKAHKSFGFDIRVIANAAFVPNMNKTFTFNNADFTRIRLADNNLTSAQLPSIFGSQKLEDRPLLEFLDENNNPIISTSTIPGSGIEEATGYNIVPSAMVQLGVGIFKNTDIKFRFVPKISEPEFEFSTIGVGVMHDLKQWIPFVNKLPLDVSAMLSWSEVKSKFYTDSDNPASDQALEFNTNTFLFQLIGSKKFSIFTVFGGLGVSSFNSDVNMLGTYQTENNTYINPISLDYKGSSFRGNLGLNIELLILNISAEYALQEYNTFTVTAGFSIR